ncbi:MAG: class I SAM-dependent methyltransferase [Actinomycetota bacterium]
MLTVDFDRLALRPGEAVLDVGCGLGRHTFEALRRGARVMSIDLDGAILKDVAAMAAALRLQGGLPSGTASWCTNGDVTGLPLRGATFDVVIASEVLEHVSDDRGALTELARVTKPGGTIVCTVPRSWPERICWRLSDEYHAVAGGHVRIYERADLEEKLTTAGFLPLGHHHAHALHAPYWWLKCFVGPANEDAAIVRRYHRMLVWDIEKRPVFTRALEQVLDPLMGKSLVVYARREEGP